MLRHKRGGTDHTPACGTDSESAKRWTVPQRARGPRSPGRARQAQRALRGRGRADPVHQLYRLLVPRRGPRGGRRAPQSCRRRHAIRGRGRGSAPGRGQCAAPPCGLDARAAGLGPRQGLILLPGSHKSKFVRPDALFGSFGNGNHGDTNPNAVPIEASVPSGAVHATVQDLPGRLSDLTVFHSRSVL